MKSLLETVEARIAALLSANLSLAAIGDFLSTLAPYLDVLVKLGQAGVAAATIAYFIYKTRAVKDAKKDDQ